MNLTELQALRDAATAGPWVASVNVHCLNHSKVTHYPDSQRYNSVCSALTHDADFICAIHDAVKMLEDVEAYAKKYGRAHIYGAEILAILEEP